jgi:hypothetical protein
MPSNLKDTFMAPGKKMIKYLKKGFLERRNP